MREKTVLFVFIWTTIVCGSALANEANEIEARGKKKKIALFVYFADLVVKKIFILKLFYAFVFWVVLHKAGYFLGWFASYLKEKKLEFHEPHHHHDYSPGSYGHSDYNPGYGYDGHWSPYKRQGQRN